MQGVEVKRRSGRSLSTLRWLIIVLLLAATLRFTGLGWRSLWLDEAFSVRHASQPLAAVWSGEGDPRHPPLYYVLLHAWMGLGQDPATIRLLSASFSWATVGLVFLLGRVVDRNRPVTALLAAALLAIAPIDLWYAQETRMYALVAFCTALTAIGLTWGSWGGILLTVAGVSLGLYADYTFIPVLVLMVAAWLGVQARRRWGASQPDDGFRWEFLKLFSVATALLLYAPIWPRLAELVRTLNDVHTIVRLRNVVGLGSIPPPFFLVMLGLGALIGGAVAFWAWPWVRRVGPTSWWAQIVLFIFALLTLLMPVPRAYSLKRIAVTGWPLLVVVAAYLAVRIYGRRGVILLLLVSLTAAFAVQATPKDDWRGAAAFVESRAVEGELIWVAPVSYALPYDYHALTPAERGTVDRLDARSAEASGIWLVTTRFPGNAVPASPAERYLNERWELNGRYPFYRLEVRHYRPPP